MICGDTHGWVVGWADGWGHVKSLNTNNQINLDQIEIILFEDL